MYLFHTLLILVSSFLIIIEARHRPLSNDLDALPWHDDEGVDALSPRDGTCRTAGCERAARLLKHSMNTSVDPCEDFYQFSCGGWIQNHPVPPTEPRANQFDMIDRKLDHQLKEILTEPEEPDDPIPVNLAKTMYRACMNTDHLEEAGVTPLADLLNELGGWPMATSKWHEGDFSWQKAVAISTRRFAVTPLIAVFVYLDRKNSNRSVVTVDQTTLVLPRAMLAEPETYSKILSGYAEWIAECAQEVAKASGHHVPSTRLHVEAHDIVDFEIELAQLTSPSEERRDSYRMYNPMSVRQLQKWSDSAATVEGAIMIDWHTLLLDVFADTNIKISPGERIIVKEIEFVLKLVALLERTPPRIVANYVMWRLVRYLNRETTQRMRELSFNFDKIYSGVKEDLPRWRECVSRSNGALTFAVGYKYVQRHFDDSSKKTAVKMVSHIREAFKVRVAESKWMDDETREAAIAKADSMSEFIGFPDWLHNTSALIHYYKGLKLGSKHFANIEAVTSFQVRQVFNKLRQPTDRTEWLSGPAIVNAYYNPLTNSITFPAGILQAPFFSKDSLEALNFGSIGVVIGHEITHGFDDMGRQIDKLGNLAQWWTEETTLAYLKLTGCFVDQYDAYRVPQLDDMLGADATVNGVTTQGENIADNGGLRQAFLAYRRFVQKYGPEPRLPGLEHLSPEQLFFLGFSTVWCENATPESLLHEVLSDPHSPHRYRVLGPLANSPEFAATWKCPKGSPMNPEQKCRIW